MKLKKIKISKLELSALLGMILSILLCAFIPFQQLCDNIYPNTIRLHILAESNSAEHQELKLAVRDNILKLGEELFVDVTTYDNAISEIEKNIDKIKKIAEDTVIQHGYNLSVDVNLVDDTFVDTRVYDNFTMPSGRYTALTIKLGSGKGKNWWCLMYPPMCITSSTNNADEPPLLKEIKGLSNTPNYEMKFASVELLQTIISIIKTPNFSLID